MTQISLTSPAAVTILLERSKIFSVAPGISSYVTVAIPAESVAQSPATATDYGPYLFDREVTLNLFLGTVVYEVKDSAGGGSVSAASIVTALDTATPAELTEIRASVSGRILSPYASAGWCIANGTNAASAQVFHYLVSVPSQFVDMRVWFANAIATPYTIDACKYALPDNISDLNNPKVGAATAPYVDVLFGGVAAPTNAIVPAGAVGRPAFLASDWMPCTALARSDGGTESLLCIRAAIGTATATYPTIVSTTSNFVHTAGSRVRYAKTAAGTTATAALSGAPSSTMCVAFVEFRTLSGVKSFMGVGDSLTAANTDLAGGGSATAWGELAAASATATLGKPVSWHNSGWPGQTSIQYYNRGVDLLAAGLRPTGIFYSPYTPNETLSSAAVGEAMMSRALDFYERCRIAGVQCILTTPAPNNNLTLAADNFRKTIVQRLRNMATAGYVIADFDLALSDGASPARYISGYNVDVYHMSLAGNTAAAAAASAKMIQL